MASIYVDNDGVRLHALDNERNGSGVPVLTIPGLGEEADEYAWQLDELGDRRVVVVDVRGRGRSGAPEHGYTWADHYGDVLAVLGATGLDRPVVIGYSRGSPYAFGAALHSPSGVRALVINDYQARQVGLGPEMVERLLEMKTRGRTTAERMPEHAVRQVVLESREIPLWDRIPELDAPVLVLRGGKSMVVDEEAQAKYLAASPRVRIETLPDRGHGLWSTKDRAPYLALLLPFLAEVDAIS
ncbi:MAG: alpha/beta fold hydrolase [Acidimicrobiia bacterium]